MWLCTTRGFFSIAKIGDTYLETKDNTEGETFNVRSRVESHLQQTFPGKRIFQYPKSDYEYRVYLTPEELNEFLLDEASNVTYSNFKNSVFDKVLHKFYESVWWAGITAFRSRPYPY
jgi:hypothetical protein